MDEITSSDTSVVCEGTLKHRDCKKWKTRWCVARKHSPVADCLNLQLYRDSKDKLKQGQTKANLSLENLLAIESGFTLDKESHTLAIICQDITVILAFESRESLIQWQVKIRTNLGEDQQFQVNVAHVPPKSKITPGPARIHVQDWLFCLVAGLPPRLLNSWQFQDLRKYGVVDGKFCFEGGSRCGKGEGLHVLTSNQAEELSITFDAASQGKLHSKKKTGKAGGKLITSGFDGTLKKSAINHTKEAPSAESTRPLLNSSESSICDACCEIARCSAGAMDCWMSTESCHLDTLSMAASEATGENGCPLKVWVPEAGAYLVDRVALLERCTEKTLLSPKWVDGETNEEKNNGKMADVLSLSSHDSNSSSSEYSVPRAFSDTYYDKPRNVIGSILASEGPSLPPRSPAKVKGDHKTTPTKSRNTSGQRQVENTSVSRCGYVWDNPAYAKTPGSANGTPLGTPMGSPKKTQPTTNSPTKMRASVQLNLLSPSRRNSGAVTPSSAAVTPSMCSCCQCESKLNPYGDYSIPRTALAHLFLKEHQAAVAAAMAAGNLTAPSSTSTSAATTPSIDKTSCSTRTSLMSSDSSGDYDVPRRVKDCLAAADAKENQSSLSPGSCLGLTLHACSCGLKGRALVPRHVGSSSCSCVRVANWAEHLVPCKQQTNVDDATNSCTHRRAILETKLCGRQDGQVKTFVHQHSCLCPESHESNEWVSRPPVDPSTKPLLGGHLQPCTTQPTANPASTLKWTAVKGSPQMANYANVDVIENKSEEKGTPAKVRVNYANLDFVDSLPLYENTGSVLAALEEHKPNEQNKVTDLSPAFGITSRCTSCGHHFVRTEPSHVSRPPSVLETPKQYQRETDDGNYLLMQPVSGRCTPLGTPLHQSMTLPRDRKSTRSSESNSDEQISSPVHGKVSSEYIRMSDIVQDIKNLPLRPFLPLEMSSRWKEFDLMDLDFFRSRSCSNSSENGAKCMNRSLSLEPHSGRSHSVVELQKEVFLRKRSSSADGRRGLSRATTAELEVSMRALMTFSPRRPLLLPRLPSANPQSKRRGSEDISSHSPRHQSNENMNKQDSLDVDVVLRNLEINTRSDSSPTNIKRSSSVPCNPGNRDSASSSDSGVSTGSPKQTPAFPTSSDNTYMEMSMVKATGSTISTEESKLVLRLKRHDSECKNAQTDGADADSVWIKRDDLKDVSPNHEIVVHPCFVDSKSNSSASDMSDYIETLSLSSHGSSDVPRVDDGPRLPCCITSTLRPRSGREYQMLDRALLEECLLHQTVEPNVAQEIPPRVESITPGLRCGKTESPTPSYGSSSSPADVQRQSMSPGKKPLHFVFPPKELNYVQVEGTGSEAKAGVSPGPNVNAVQYATIDVVATCAVKDAFIEKRRAESPCRTRDRNPCNPHSHH